MENWQFQLSPGQKAIITVDFFNSVGRPETSGEEKRYDLLLSGTYDTNSSSSVHANSLGYRNSDESSSPMEVPLNTSETKIIYDLVTKFKYTRSGRFDWRSLACQSKELIAPNKYRILFRQQGVTPRSVFFHFIRTEIFVEVITEN